MKSNLYSSCEVWQNSFRVEWPVVSLKDVVLL